MEKTAEPEDKFLEADEGPEKPQPPTVDAMAKQKMQSKEGLLEGKKIAADKVYQVMKALTAMKMTKEDNKPGAVFPELFIGSVGAAYNKEALKENGITHILTCAANLKPRYAEVSVARDIIL